MKNLKIWIVTAVVLLMVTLPFLFAYQDSGSNARFGGFFINPLDGNSYLAKMYQGREGSWTFTLPYTAEPGSGTYLFLFYLFLGHLAAWFELPLLLVFHIARLLSTGLMLFALAKYFSRVFESKTDRNNAYLLTVVGGGLGWLIYPLTSQLTPDFWISEAYPFLSAFANPHFPLSIAILLALLMLYPSVKSISRGLFVLLCASLLSIIQPFGVVIVGIIYLGLAIWDRISEGIINWKPLFYFGIGGMPMLIYQYMLVQNHSVLAGWNAQNLTPSPGFLLFFVGFSPALLLAIVGAWAQIKNKLPIKKSMLLWATLGIGLLYIPIPLQRRMMLGLFIPICGLAIDGVSFITQGNHRKYNLINTLAVGLSVPSMLLVIFSGINAAAQRNPEIYLSTSEIEAFNWIENYTDRGSTILASSKEGLYIPAYTGRRVIYGHPYETVNAEANKHWVDDIFASSLPISAGELAEKKIDYIFFGPRERKICSDLKFHAYPVAYQNQEVTIYSMTAQGGS